MKRILLAILMCSMAFTQAALAANPVISVNQFVEHPALDSVLKGIQDHFKNKGIAIDYKIHNAQANMGTATQIAQQMVGEKADLLIAIATPSAQACAQALKKAPQDMKRPLLFSAITDPVAAGLVRDLKQPGGDISGVSDLLPLKEHMEMLKTFMPKLKRLGVLYNSGEANSKATIATLKTLSKEMGFEVVEATASKTAEVYQAAKSLVGKVDAIFVPTDNTIVSAFESVVKVGMQNNLPVFAADVDSVSRGAVAAMGFDYYKHGLQTGAMAERILNGEKIADMPVEFQKNLELYINLKYAEKMGVTPPQSLLDRATKIYK